MPRMISLVLLAACTSPDGGSDPWSAAATSDGGLYEVLMSAPDTTLATGVDVDVTLTVTDATTSEPVDGTVRFWADMPSMGHATDAVDTTALGDGVFSTTLLFSMPGAWTLTAEIAATPGDDTCVVAAEVQ